MTKAVYISIGIGAVLGLIVGYFAYAVSQGATGAFGFSDWLRYRFGYADVLWCVVGGAIGGGVYYVRLLDR